jgi:putative tricarboxylic transport membrane protein
MTEPSAAPTRGFSLPDVLFATGGALLGAFVLWQSLSLEVAPTYARVSPQFFPLIVGAGITLTSLWLLVNALRGDRAEPAVEEDSDPNAPVDWVAFALIGAGIALQILLMNPLGFIISSSLLFTLTARAFRLKQSFSWGSLALDAAIAVALSGVAYVAFTSGLGLGLPVGKLWGGG